VSRAQELEKLGVSFVELHSGFDKTKEIATSPYEYLPQQYLFTIVSGKGKLDDITNDRYPQIELTPVSEYIRQVGL
jgi:hypothetical protein